MNVLLLNTYAHGGAGIAARRLQAALQEKGVTANLLTAADVPGRWPFYAERLSFVPFERDKSVRFSFSLANFGHDLSRHTLVQSADVLHLHWINQGFLALQNIRQLALLGKPIVWTLHDMWAFTGGCHYSHGCDHFQVACGFCPFLRRPGPRDLSHRVWARKQRLFPDNLHFVTCSEWLADVARSSSLLGNSALTAIPNPIDTRIFKPATAAERAAFRLETGIAPEAKVLLFAAMKINEDRKGFRYLLEALHILRKQRPDLRLEIVVLGQSDPELAAALPYPVHLPGLIQSVDALARLYRVADVFAIPSLEDNLPNTVMEALACGAPVVGFRTGGIPEMVGHRHEGFIAAQGDSQELAEGIFWVLEDDSALETLRQAARRKVERLYANEVVATRYIAHYQQIMRTQ